MKRLIFISLLIANSFCISFAQRKKTPVAVKPILEVQEKVILSTDRTLYFSGERILFKANRTLADFNNDTLFSKVLYLELYDKNDKPIIQKKEQIINGVSCGSIEIPTDVVTGNYYLRAYTQYMRNFKKELFYISQITIINPDLPSKESIQTIKSKRDTLLKDSDNGLEIVTSKEVFPTRSLIKLDLKGQDYADLSVSVVKKGSYEENNVGINNYLRPIAETDATADVKWYPEIRAVNLSGKVIDKKTGQPIKDILIYVSIIDNGKQFHVFRTKSSGEFIFSLPNLNEGHKVYISAQKQEGKEISVLINRDFSPDFPKLDLVQENIDSNKINLINEMYLNYQVAKGYNNSLQNKKSFLDTLPDPFSEKYENTILKDYVDLPGMVDIFNEIVPYTHVKKSGKDASIQIFDKKNKTIYTQPLILLDGIPYQDDAALLGLAPSKILSVGVIAQPFVHGSEIINGIMNIKSADGNLGGLQLPKELVVIDYITYSPLTSQQFKEYKQKEESEIRNPDFRNTMYWNPSVLLNDGNATVQFYASDYASDYDIIVRGVDENGKLIFKIRAIKIDNATQ